MITSEAARVETLSSQFDWNIDDVVTNLRRLRNEGLAARDRTERPSVLPSRSQLSRIVDGFSMALFPNRLSSRHIATECIDYFVGQTLDGNARDLADQVHLELVFRSRPADRREDTMEAAIVKVREFLARLPQVRMLLDTDIHAAYVSDPAARSADEVIVCYPGIFALIHHRLSHELYQLDLPLVARMISEIAHSKTGIDIHPGATIGESLFIDHGTGIVIGETAIIGNRVRLHHGVTLGALPCTTHTLSQRRFGSDNPRHPRVEDEVTICAGATLLGRINIGQGATIGSNVIVTEDVPAGSRVNQAHSIIDAFVEGAGI